MITSDHLDNLQAEVSEVANIVDALKIISWRLDRSCTGEDRLALNALLGSVNAAGKQLERVHAGFEPLFAELRSENGLN